MIPKNERQAIDYNVTGQTIKFYPPEWVRGVPTGTPTYSVRWTGYNDDADAEFSGDATVDSVSTTVDAASGFAQTNRKRVNLTATTDIATDKLYLLENAAGQRELVRPTAISAGAYVDVEDDLVYNYAASDTFKGLEMSFTVDATFIADTTSISLPDNPYRVGWSYTIDSVAYRFMTYFDVVRHPKGHHVTHRDLFELFPDLAKEEWRGQRGEKYAKQIDAAAERVWFDLRMHDINANEVEDQQVLNELVRCAAIMVIAEAGISPGGREIESWVQERQRRYEHDLMKSITKIQMDKEGDGAITADPLRQEWFKR